MKLKKEGKKHNTRLLREYTRVIKFAELNTGTQSSAGEKTGNTVRVKLYKASSISNRKVPERMVRCG